MARPQAPEEDRVVESWESLVPGTVWLWIFDRREDQYKKTKLGGTGRRVHISRDDRKFNQEQVNPDRPDLDPFVNGMLRLVSGDADPELNRAYHLTDEELRGWLDEKDEDAYYRLVNSITSEVIIRRFATVAEKYGSIWQFEYVREAVENRFRLGGTQKTIREMLDAGEKLGVAAL